MVTPRIIVHGGAGNITRDNLPPAQYAAYRTSLLRILTSSHAFLTSIDQETGRPRSALDAAVHAVSLLELDPLFNCGHGAVFTNQGTNELEASVMVSRGHRKRGAAVSMLRRVKSPITLAATLLKKGDEEDAGGAQGHVHISGPECERLAGEWGLELVDPSYFWTRKRWEQHKKGVQGVEPPPEGDKPGKGGDGEELCASKAPIDKRPDGTEWREDDPHWDGKEYIPRGTVGCVVLDSDGVLAVATSTGGLTNKLSGRIGDTPSFGAGFWAEEWADIASLALPLVSQQVSSIPAAISSWLPGSPLASLTSKIANLSILRPLHECFAAQSSAEFCSTPVVYLDEKHPAPPATRGVALGGTGNGDSFLRLSAASTVASLVKFSSPTHSLQTAMSWMADPHGQLQQSAGPRWGGKEGEGEGGLIGIEFVNGEGRIVAGFNRAMFRTWVDEEGKQQCMVFRDDY